MREEVRAALREHAGAAAAAEPDLVALGEVKRWVQVSKSTLKKWIAAGRLPKYGEGRLVRVRLAEVRAVMKQRSSPATSSSSGPRKPSSDVERILSTIPGGKD